MHCNESPVELKCSRLFLSPADEDEESAARRVPLSPLDRFFSDDESLKEQKKEKKKPAKLKEGKMPKVKKKKKEVKEDSIFFFFFAVVGLFLETSITAKLYLFFWSNANGLLFLLLCIII